MVATQELFSFKILRTDLREYVIERVKAPLRKVIIMAANRLPEITRENTRYKNTHTLMGIFDDFFTHYNILGTRTDMLKGAFKICLSVMDKTFTEEQFEAGFKAFMKATGEDFTDEELQAASKIFFGVVEHDVLYRDPFNYLLEEIIKAILRGDWEERTNGQPDAPLWLEQGQYGGKYSIMRHIEFSEDVVSHQCSGVNGR